MLFIEFEFTKVDYTFINICGVHVVWTTSAQCTKILLLHLMLRATSCIWNVMHSFVCDVLKRQHIFLQMNKLSKWQHVTICKCFGETTKSYASIHVEEVSTFNLIWKIKIKQILFNQCVTYWQINTGIFTCKTSTRHHVSSLDDSTVS